MCGGVKYTDKQNKTWTVYFPSSKAALPVLKRDGEIECVIWGKRKEENVPAFPNGGSLYTLRSIPIQDAYAFSRKEMLFKCFDS